MWAQSTRFEKGGAGCQCYMEFQDMVGFLILKGQRKVLDANSYSYVVCVTPPNKRHLQYCTSKLDKVQTV